MNNKRTLVGKQIVIMLYLIAAAVSALETTIEYGKGGFSNWKVYFFGGIFLFAASMYFIRRKQRFVSKNN